MSHIEIVGLPIIRRVVQHNPIRLSIKWRAKAEVCLNLDKRAKAFRNVRTTGMAKSLSSLYPWALEMLKTNIFEVTTINFQMQN